MESKTQKLERMLAFCKTLGVELRYHPEERYFTAMAWSGERQFNDDPALAIQRQIQNEAARYPEIVCYCFDPCSTLVYAV